VGDESSGGNTSAGNEKALPEPEDRRLDI